MSMPIKGTKYNFDKSILQNNSVSTDISGGEGYGALNSSIDLGSGNNNATISVTAGNKAVGFRSTSLHSGNGDDSFSLNVNASGEHSYTYTGDYDYASSGHDIGSNSGNSNSWHISQSNNRYWWWGNHQSQSEYTSEWNNSWDRNHEYSNKSTSEYSNTQRFGNAVGAEDSTIDLGNGDNTAQISVQGGEHARGLVNSDLVTGSGSDNISISSNADGMVGYSNKHKGSYSNRQQQQL